MTDTLLEKDNQESVEDVYRSESTFSEVEAYKSVCKTAVTSVIFGILGLTAFLAQAFVIVPALAMVFAIMALGAIKKYPDELVGKGAARFGLIAGAVCLVASLAMHSFIYATEVPDGYRRISFAELKPSRTSAKGPPERSQEFDGQKVFIKGYVRPPSGKKYGLKNFIMVGDFGDCCFGGDPALTDVVAVKIQTDDTVNYGYGYRRIGGTFRLNPNQVQSDEKEIPRVYYELEADYVR